MSNVNVEFKPKEHPKFKGYFYSKEFPHCAVNRKGEVIRTVTDAARRSMLGKPITPYMVNGYYSIRTFCAKRDKSAPCKLHRVVACAFLGSPPNDNSQVDHIDNCRTNNLPENLRWVKPKENIADQKTLKSATRAIAEVSVTKLSSGKTIVFNSTIAASNALGHVNEDVVGQALLKRVPDSVVDGTYLVRYAADTRALPNAIERRVILEQQVARSFMAINVVDGSQIIVNSPRSAKTLFGIDERALLLRLTSSMFAVYKEYYFITLLRLDLLGEPSPERIADDSDSALKHPTDRLIYVRKVGSETVLHRTMSEHIEVVGGRVREMNQALRNRFMAPYKGYEMREVWDVGGFGSKHHKHTSRGVLVRSLSGGGGRYCKTVEHAARYISAPLERVRAHLKYGREETINGFIVSWEKSSDDVTEIPVANLESPRPASDVVVIDMLSGEKVHGGSAKQVSKWLGLSESSVSKGLSLHPMIRNGKYLVRFADTAAAIPSLVEFADTPHIGYRAVEVLNLTNGTSKKYPNVKEVAEDLGLNASKLRFEIPTSVKGTYKQGQYEFRYIESNQLHPV